MCGTFGKTGTNTVTLFLRRKAINPDPSTHYRERIEEWFSGLPADQGNEAVYQDAQLIASYAAHIGIPATDYKTLMRGVPSAAFLAHETFAACVKEFENSTEITNLKKQKKFKALTADEKSAELHKRLLTHLFRIEKDKLLHYILAKGQNHPVLILKGPTDTKERKTFLGYDWSSAKGDEGIKLIKDAAGLHLTPLYDEGNRDNPEKISHAIAQNFRGELSEISESLQPYLTLAPLPSLLDFSSISFDKQLSLSSRQTLIVSSKWPIVKLGDCSEINPSKRAISGLARGTLVSFVEMASVTNLGFIEGAIDRPIDELKKGSFTYFADDDLIIAKITPCMENGKCAHALKLTNGIGMGSSEFHVVRTDKSTLLAGYAFSHLNRESVRKAAESNMTGSSGHRRVPSDFYSALPIPLPPLEIQRKIVAECEAVDKEANQARAAIEQARQSIVSEVEAAYSSDAVRRTIDSVALAIQYGLSKSMNESGIGYKIFRMNEIARGRMVDGGKMKTIDITPEEFEQYKLKSGDVLFNRTNSIEHVGKTGLYALDGEHTFASYLVRIVPDEKQINPLFLSLMMNSSAFQTEAKASAAKAINQANINATKMRNMLIPVPTLKDQKRFVKAVEEQEAQITAAESVLAATPARKAAILKKHLE